MMRIALCFASIVFAFQVAAAGPMTVTIRAGGRTGPGYADGAVGVSGYGGPTGVAVDSVGNIYIADRMLHTIRRITPAGESTTFAGRAGVSGQVNGRGAAARFTNPYHIAVDSSGNVYVSEETTYRLLRISPQGVVSTVVSSLPTRPAALTVDAVGNIFFAGTKEIYKVTPAGSVSLFAAAGEEYIASLAFDPNGILYAGTTGSSILRVMPNGAHTLFASAGGAVVSGLKIDASGTMYASLMYSNQIVRVTPAGVSSVFAGDGQEGSVDGPAASARFLLPRDLALTAGGDVYVVEEYVTTVRKVTQSQIVSTIGGSARQQTYVNGDLTTVRFVMPTETVGDSNGNLFVADLRSIRKIAADGTVTLFAGHPFEGDDIDGLETARFNDITGLTIDSIGNLYVTTSGHVVRRIAPSGFVFTLAGLNGTRGSDNGNGSNARFWNPQGLVADASGNVYVADAGNSLIRMVTASGEVSTIAGLANTPGDLDGTGSAARFRTPSGLTIDDSGVIYVADSGSHTIRKLTMPGGAVTTLAGLGLSAGTADGSGTAARFRSPYDVEFLDGLLYVADGGNRLIRAVTLAGDVSTVAGFAGVVGNVEGTGPIAAMSGSNRLGRDNAGNLILTDHFTANLRNVRAPGIPDVATASSASPATGTVVSLSTDVETATSWQWSILRRPAGSSAQLTSSNTRNTNFTPDVADTFIFLLRAEGAAGVRFSTVEVTPTDGCEPLASAVATLSGSASMCLTETTGATANVAVSGGGAPTIQWGWRATPNGNTTAISGESAPSYVLNGADFGSAGTFYLVATVTSTCGVSLTSNPIAIEVTAPPNATISGSSGVYANESHNFASVANGGEGAAYSWSITNGTITSGAGSKSIQYTAGATGSVTLDATITRNGCSSAAQLAVPILTRNGSASLFYLVTPCRVIDTRGGAALASNATRIVNVGGACGVPLGATAAAVNLTVVGPTTTGFLALYPSNTSWPGTSTINYRSGKTRANSAVVRLAPEGTLSVLNNGAATHFLIDVTGYFR